MRDDRAKLEDADTLRRERDALHRRVAELEAKDLAQAAALAAGERRFRAIFEHAPLGIGTLDMEGRILDSNVALQRMLRYSGDQLRGMTYRQLSHPEDLPRTERLVAELRSGAREQYQMEKRYLRGDGSVLWGHVTASLVRSPGGTPEFVVIGMVEDITARKEAELALAEARADYERLVQHSPDGIAVHDGRSVLFVNPAGARILGVADPAALIGKAVMKFVHPDSQDDASDRIAALQKHMEVAPIIDERFVRPDGTVIDVEVAATQMTYRDQPAILVMFRDVSERRRAQAAIAAQAAELRHLNEALRARNEAVEAEISQRTAALSESERKFRLVFEHARIGIVLANEGNRLVAANPAVCEMLGYDEAEIKRLGVKGITHPDDWPTDEAFMQELVDGRRDYYALEKRYVRKDGSTIWGALTVSVIRDAAGRVAFGVALIENITERKRLEDNLRTQNERLRVLDRLKTDFVNAVSHELRTPLTSIVGYAEFLEDEVAGPLSDQQMEFVRQIQEGTQRLRRLVDDLLDFARLEAGTFALTLREAELGQRVREVVESLRPQARAKRLALEVHLPDEPLSLAMDGGRVAQVLINLVGNAIKFTPEGGRITVSACRTADAVRVEVTDSGIGIAPEHQLRLFQKFYQVDPTSTRESGGAGLGLSISKAIVEAHGGQIGAESAPGAGSTFWFTLPTTPREG